MLLIKLSGAHKEAVCMNQILSNLIPTLETLMMSAAELMAF